MTAGPPRRIAYVIGELGKGGAEYQLHELLRHLDRARFTPSVFALAGGGYWADRIRALDVPVAEIPRGGSVDLSRLRRLRAALRAARPDVLHTILWSANVYGRLAAVGLGIPLVLAAERNTIRRPAWQVAVERGLDRMTDGYLVNCEAIAALLVEHEGLSGQKIRVVPNGIDLGTLPAFGLAREGARRALGFDPARRLVAQVGRLAPQKDYPTFFHAAATVAAAHPDVDFLVVGEGAERPALEALVARLGLAPRVRFAGLRDDVPALLGAVDVLALTSLYEGFPNVVVEAMATGAVAVATDVGGCRELVLPGETGFLVPPGDPPAVAAAVLRVLGDAELAGRLATAARGRIEREFDVHTMATRTMAAYDALLPRGKGA